MLRNNSSNDSGWIVAASHVLCALVGGGVLSLPHAVSWTGAIPGALCLAAFFGVGVCSALLLVAARTTPRDGVQHATYYGATRAALGPRAAAAVAVFQNANNVLSATGYTIAAGQSARMIAEAAGGAPRPGFSAALSGVFGLAQVAMSQLPSLEEAWWSSALGALMSMLYAGCAVALSALALGRGEGVAAAAAAASSSAAAEANDDARLRSLFLGRRAPTPALKAFGVFNALGALMFAFNFSSVQIEVHDTLHEPPDSDRAMRRATVWALSAALVVYAAVAFSGHAALGASAPGDVLTGFSSPRWLVAAANAFVLVHMFGAFQLFSQPVFQLAEAAVLARWPRLELRRAGGEGGGGDGGEGARAGRRRAGGRRRRGDDDQGTSSLIANGNGGSSSGGRGGHGPSPPRVLMPGGGIYRPGGGGGGGGNNNVGFAAGEIELGGAESWQATTSAYGRPPPSSAFRLDDEEEEEEEGGGNGEERRRRAGGVGGGSSGKPPGLPLPPAPPPPPALNTNNQDADDDAASSGSASSGPSLNPHPHHPTDRPPRAGLPLRLALRTAYVVAVTAAAVAFEGSFEGIVGLGGAVVYWPQAVYVPTAIYLATRQPPRRVRRALAALNAAVGVLAALATFGAVHSLMSGLMAAGGHKGAGVGEGAGAAAAADGQWPAADEVVFGPPELPAPPGRRRSAFF
jgi:amino acid permease